MNLHGMASGLIGFVNPNITGTVMQSAGTYTTEADGTRVPDYVAILGVPMQVQALSQSDVRKTEGLNIQGVSHSVYLNGRWRGVVRASQEGGDLLVIDGRTWLATAVLESWPDWTKLMITLQNEP